MKNIFKGLFKKRGVTNLERYTLHTIPTMTSVFSQKNDDGINAIDLIASYFASLSLKVYSSQNRQEVKDHWFSDLIKNPNLDDIQFMFLYQIAYDYFYHGNTFIFVYIDNSRNIPVSLFRIPPEEIGVSRNAMRQKFFSFNNKEYTAKNILHIPSRYGYDGTVGKSIFDVNPETFNTFKNLNAQLNGSTQNYAIEGDRPVLDISEKFSGITDDQAKEFRDRFISEYAGQENLSKPIVLTKGMKLSSLKGAPISQREQQFFENRKEQKEIISDVFQIPRGFFSGDTKFDLESLHILLLDTAIRPLVLTVGQHFNKLLDRFDHGLSYAEFNFNSLLRTSLQTRVDSYAKQLANGVLTPNEIRELEGRPLTTDDSGDNLFIPANLLPLQKEIIDSFLASSREKLSKMENEKESAEEKDLLNIGDDKK